MGTHGKSLQPISKRVEALNESMGFLHIQKDGGTYIGPRRWKLYNEFGQLEGICQLAKLKDYLSKEGF